MYMTLEVCDRQTDRQNCNVNISSAFVNSSTPGQATTLANN